MYRKIDELTNPLPGPKNLNMKDEIDMSKSQINGKDSNTLTNDANSLDQSMDSIKDTTRKRSGSLDLQDSSARLNNSNIHSKRVGSNLETLEEGNI